jgi:hypothetical protein
MPRPGDLNHEDLSLPRDSGAGHESGDIEGTLGDRRSLGHSPRPAGCNALVLNDVGSGPA